MVLTTVHVINIVVQYIIIIIIMPIFPTNKHDKEIEKFDTLLL